MSGTRLHCQETAGTLRRILTDSIHCERQGDALVLDTPYTFGDGNMLGVSLRHPRWHHRLRWRIRCDAVGDALVEHTVAPELSALTATGLGS